MEPRRCDYVINHIINYNYYVCHIIGLFIIGIIIIEVLCVYIIILYLTMRAVFRLINIFTIKMQIFDLKKLYNIVFYHFMTKLSSREKTYTKAAKTYYLYNIYIYVILPVVDHWWLLFRKDTWTWVLLLLRWIWKPLKWVKSLYYIAFYEKYPVIGIICKHLYVPVINSFRCIYKSITFF